MTEMITQPDTANTVATATETIGGYEALPPLVPDLDADPFDGIPAALLNMVGSYDRDTAGGCG